MLPENSEKLRAAVQARLAAIVQSSDDAIVSKNLDGFVVTWNKGAERLFGYTSDEMVGRHISTIIPDDRQDEEPMILDRLRRGERVDHFETVRRRKDGSLIEISVTISPLRDETGQVIGASKIARDISQQKHYERELVEARRIADLTRKLAEDASRAKDHFLSTLSHELRTPLTPVLAAVSFMEQFKETLPASIAEQIGMIRRNVEAEARLVDDLLDVTRISRGKLSLHFEAVDAHAVVRNVVSMYQNQIDDKGLTVTMSLRARDFHVWADPGRFQQIVLNLLSNAVKFTPRDGTITIRTSDAPDQLQVEITDTGVGIDSELLPRLFNAFEQGEQSITRRFGGLGLGLSIVKSLVELHHGTIQAHSEGPNKGATFTFTINNVPAEQRKSDLEKVTQSSCVGRRILLVEDHADTRQIMCLLLRSFGCVVSVASNVKEATELAEREQFDLLVSDIGLPDGTGVDVMRQVSQRQNVSGIAISGFGQEEDLRRTMEAGFSLHLTKPVNLKMLQEAIDRIVV